MPWLVPGEFSLNGTLFVLVAALKWHEIAVTAAVLLYLWIFFGLRKKTKC
jgi:hypothetical protein